LNETAARAIVFVVSSSKKVVKIAGNPPVTESIRRQSRAPQGLDCVV